MKHIKKFEGVRDTVKILLWSKSGKINRNKIINESKYKIDDYVYLTNDFNWMNRKCKILDIEMMISKGIVTIGDSNFDNSISIKYHVECKMYGSYDYMWVQEYSMERTSTTEEITEYILDKETEKYNL